MREESTEGLAAGKTGKRTAASSIREARQSLQMTGGGLAKRLGVSPARVSVLERDERRGAVTLRMMERAANALDCEFVYALVPRQGAGRGAKRKLRLDCEYQSFSREQQLRDLEARLERSVLDAADTHV